MQILLANEDYTISYDSDIRCSYLKFLKKTDESILKDAYLDVIPFFEERRIEKHITNTSKMGLISIDSQKWFSTEILPMMVNRSAKHHLQLGFILGLDVFSIFGPKSMARKAVAMSSDEIQINFFSEEEEAMDWMYMAFAS